MEPIPGGPIRLERRRPLRLPPDDSLQRVCPEFWAYVEPVFRDRARPITGPVWLEIARRVAYKGCLTRNDPDAELFHFTELQRVERELGELLSLVTAEPDRSALANEMLEWLIRNGGSSSGVAQDIVKCWNRRKGRTATRRQLAVRALEMQILNPGLKWAEIGDRLNYPKAVQRSVSETLPAEVRHVKKILQRYGLWDDRRHSSQKAPRKK